MAFQISPFLILLCFYTINVHSLPGLPPPRNQTLERRRDESPGEITTKIKLLQEQLWGSFPNHYVGEVTIRSQGAMVRGESATFMAKFDTLSDEFIVPGRRCGRYDFRHFLSAATWLAREFYRALRVEIMLQSLIDNTTVSDGS